MKIAIIVGIWFSILAFFLTTTPMRTRFSQIQYYLSKAMGAMLIAFGIKLALQHQK